MPGLPHRTGHGIGMDGHEWANMIKENEQLLQPGICFSVEPIFLLSVSLVCDIRLCVHDS